MCSLHLIEFTHIKLGKIWFIIKVSGNMDHINVKYNISQFFEAAKKVVTWKIKLVGKI